MNRVILIGRLGRDPEIKYTQDGTPKATMSVATDYGSGDNKKTTWHRVIAWRKTAELCGEYLSKGRQVAIEGRIDNRKYTGDDGADKYISEVVADRVEFVGGRNDGSKGAEHDHAPPPMSDDDVPF